MTTKSLLRLLVVSTKITTAGTNTTEDIVAVRVIGQCGHELGA
jgi:hypothetical protein